MTIYKCHIYREMKLRFDGIEADTPEAAAAIAHGKPTGDADDIDDCDGEDFAALVDVAGDEEYEQSRTIDFEPERQRKAAPKLLAALEAILPVAKTRGTPSTSAGVATAIRRSRNTRTRAPSDRECPCSYRRRENHPHPDTVGHRSRIHPIRLHARTRRRPPTRLTCWWTEYSTWSSCAPMKEWSSMSIPRTGLRRLASHGRLRFRRRDLDDASAETDEASGGRHESR